MAPLRKVSVLTNGFFQAPVRCAIAVDLHPFVIRHPTNQMGASMLEELIATNTRFKIETAFGRVFEMPPLAFNNEEKGEEGLPPPALPEVPAYKK